MSNLKINNRTFNQYMSSNDVKKGRNLACISSLIRNHIYLNYLYMPKDICMSNEITDEQENH